MTFCFAFSYRARLSQAQNKKDASARGPSAARWAAPGAGSASSCTGQYSPSPPKSPHSWASLGAPSPIDAHDALACGAHHEVTAAGGSSSIEFAGAAPRRPKTCPNATRNAHAFRSHSPANFEFPRPCRQPRRGAHHEHQRDHRDAAEEGRRLVRASLKGFAFTASPSSGGPRPRPQKGPAALPDLRASGSSRRPRRS